MKRRDLSLATRRFHIVVMLYVFVVWLGWVEWYDHGLYKINVDGGPIRVIQNSRELKIHCIP